MKAIKCKYSEQPAILSFLVLNTSPQSYCFFIKLSVQRISISKAPVFHQHLLLPRSPFVILKGRESYSILTVAFKTIRNLSRPFSANIAALFISEILKNPYSAVSCLYQECESILNLLSLEE